MKYVLAILFSLPIITIQAADYPNNRLPTQIVQNVVLFAQINNGIQGNNTFSPLKKKRHKQPDYQSAKNTEEKKWQLKSREQNKRIKRYNQPRKNK